MDARAFRGFPGLVVELSPPRILAWAAVGLLGLVGLLLLLANLDALASTTAVPAGEAGAIVIHVMNAVFLDAAWVWLPDEVSNHLVPSAHFQSSACRSRSLQQISLHMTQ